ncbi:hypothetical protein C0991_000533 [Blastosporella zonata]|nr:hypothetical protein C0991_000533 [Blastosporella zonata]
MPTVVQDNELPREPRDTRTPAKKNKTTLDATEEEDDVSRSRSNSGSPPLSASPPQEMKIKVRQISQGVEDINWRNKTVINLDKDIGIDPTSTSTAVEDDKDSSDASDGSADGEEVAESDSTDKSLKRKLSERGTSQGPQDSAQAPPEPLKRSRDDAEKDENPRETKRPSPPPPPESKSPKSPKKAPATLPATSKLNGFMAYASPNSPFSAVKGQNIFASNKAASPPPPEKQPPAPPMTIFGSADPSSSSSTPAALKRTGFEAFASPLSPFASASRSKSPVLGSTSKLGRSKSPPRRGNSMNSNAFSSYANGVQSFAIPPSKRARAGTPNSSAEGTPAVSVFGRADDGAISDSGDEDEKDAVGSFSARLRAGKNVSDEGDMEQQSMFKLTEQPVLTGEEDEQTVHQVRGKLFSLVDGTQWKERGTGTLKLNVKRSDGSGARLVMRKEALANAKIAKELLEEIMANIPSV